MILKLSGESFVHPGERGISMEEVVHIARQVSQARLHGAEIAIVIGGGNILRGAQFTAGNAAIVEQGPLPPDRVDAVRSRYALQGAGWRGET